MQLGAGELGPRWTGGRAGADITPGRTFWTSRREPDVSRKGKVLLLLEQEHIMAKSEFWAGKSDVPTQGRQENKRTKLQGSFSLCQALTSGQRWKLANEEGEAQPREMLGELRFRMLWLRSGCP